MAKLAMSTKRIAINKTNAQMVTILAVASFVTIFCLVASHAVWGQNQYIARVIKDKTTARRQLQQNVTAFAKLKDSYLKFDNSPTNVLGGSSTDISGSNNANIILDALPSSYDFPALTSTVEKILKDNKYTFSSITGTDDQVAQQGNISSPSPQPVPMPFSFTVTSANYASIQQLITTLQLSIRPIQLDTLALSGGGNNMTAVITAHTYYQPGKALTITKKVVK